jgi:electron-transferring-flavoprotein dehydrogenase
LPRWAKDAALMKWSLNIPQVLQQSWLWEELYQVRNIKPSFSWGLWAAIAYSALDTYMFRGKAPWTLHHKPDHAKLKKASECPKIEYPKPDGKVSFDRLSSVFISNTNHERGSALPSDLERSGSADSDQSGAVRRPGAALLPGGRLRNRRDSEGNNPRLQINAQNCVHCKTCDIKDPTQNINWATPEGGGGPNYPNM